MKHFTAVLALALAAVTLPGCGGNDPVNDDGGKEENKTPEIENFDKYQKFDCKVRDLALIYQGGLHRIDWTEEELQPYVTHRFVGGGKEEWLFDGFLFLEFTTGGNGGRRFCEGSNEPNAKRDDYEWYLDRLFEKGKSLDALDKLITKKKKTLGDPGFRHKIALTTFVPVKDQTDWGELDGETMSFRREGDRATVAKWFIDQLVERFNAAGYENLDLYAIYMLVEDTFNVVDLSKAIAPHIKAKGLDYIWIPYYKAWGIERWKELGFDMAYHQPNHFFTENIPDTRLDDAINYARSSGMALEFECDERALSQNGTSFRSRMVSYLDYFEKYGVWYDTPVAYYTGNHLLLDFARESTPLNAALSDRLCRFIVARRLAAQR